MGHIVTMAQAAGGGGTPQPAALVAVPKVTGLEEQQLVPLGFRSQKDLSIVSQQEVWRLLDGCIGSDPALCTMCIRNKAVAPRHASVRHRVRLASVGAWGVG